MYVKLLMSGGDGRRDEGTKSKEVVVATLRRCVVVPLRTGGRIAGRKTDVETKRRRDEGSPSGSKARCLCYIPRAWQI